MCQHKREKTVSHVVFVFRRPNVIKEAVPSLPSSTASSKPHACSFRISTAIFATFAHLVSARECGNEASHVTLSAVEAQQVVARLTTMEVINVAPPPAITDAARVGTKMPSRHPRWDLHRATRAPWGEQCLNGRRARMYHPRASRLCATLHAQLLARAPSGLLTRVGPCSGRLCPPRCWSLSVPAQRRLPPQSHTEVGRCCCRAGWMPVRMLPAVAGPVCRYP